MLHLSIPFYANKRPENNELVLVKINEINEERSYFYGNLLEYQVNAYLRFEDATKKKRINSWNNIVPINKEIVARVDECDFSEDSVKISLTYMDEKDAKDEKFKKNKTLVTLVKNIIFELWNKNTIEEVIPILNDIWEKVFYKIDLQRQEEYDSENLPTLLDYCIQEIDNLEEYFSDNFDFYEKFKESLNTMVSEKSCKLVSTIGIVSSNGVSSTKKLLEKILDDINYNYSLTYNYYKEKDKKSYPAYIFETLSIDSNEEDHSAFIKMLEVEGGKLNPKIFIKTFEKCKKVI